MTGFEIREKRNAMETGGKIIARTVKDLESWLREGITTQEIDNEAARLIRHYGGEVSFSKVPGYKWATCLSVNEVVVHGVPNKYALQDGDVLKLDIGAFYHGYHVDYGDTYVIGTPSNPTIKHFLDIGRTTLKQILKMARKGVFLGEISNRIEKNIQGAGYKVLKDLTGHAVGRELHEDPLIPGILTMPILKTPKMEAGTAYALEVIYSYADEQTVHANADGWSLKTKKGSQSACFENSVFVDENETIILVS